MLGLGVSKNYKSEQISTLISILQTLRVSANGNMKRKFIVTGGAGLIGSNIVRELNQMDEVDILIVDHLGNTEKWKNLLDLKYKDYIEKDDFLNRIQTGNPFKKYTHTIHMGACSSTTETDASYLIQNNFEYTKVLCEYSLSNETNFIYASSAATYGDGANGYDDRSDLNNLRPLNMYGYSKHMFDLYARQKGIADKITGLKFFNVFGYGEGHKGDMRSVVMKGYEQIKSTGSLSLFKSYNEQYANGEQKRDFLYVKDAARICLFLLLEKKFGLFNLGRGVAETWNDLANALFKAMGLPVNIQYIEMPESLRPKYQYYTKAETLKLITAGYEKGFTSLENAIKEYVSLLQ